MKARGMVALLALLAVACGGGGTGGGGGQLGALSHHVTVNFWEAMAGGALKPTLEQLTQQFNSSQSNVTVNLQVYPDYNTLLTKTEAALAAGTPPDLAQCYPNWAAKYNQSHAIVDMTPFVEARDGLSPTELADIHPKLLKDGQLGGKQFMFPFNKSVPVLYYNPVLFEQASISGPPRTWTELATDAQKLTGPGHWGIDIGNSLESTFEGQLQDYGGSLLSADGKKATFNSEAGVRALQLWVDMYRNGSAHFIGDKYDDADYASSHEGMSIGTIAGYSYKRPVNNAFKVTTAPVPAGPKGSHVELFGTNVCIFAKAPRDVQQGAFQFVKFFTSKESTMTWSEKTGYVPVRQSAVQQMEQSFYKDNPNLKVAVDELPNAFSGPALPIWNEAAQDIQTELFNAVQGRKTAKQALDDAANQVNQLLQSGG